jgi:archaeosine synthase alpha-subunit
MLDVIAHSQRGRVCEYKRGDASVRTPAVITASDSESGVMYVSLGPDGRTFHAMGTAVRLDEGLQPTVSSGVASEIRCVDGICVARFPIPDGASAPEDAEMVVVPNGYELRNDARKLVDNLVRMREFAGFGRILVVLGLAEPSTLALLTYMGVDITDDALPAAMGLSGISSIPEGEIAVGSDVSEDNRAEMAREMSKVAVFTAAGRLRELVDQRAPSSPRSVAALRIFDDAGYAFQEEACSTVGGRFACNTTQALKRPDIRRYQDMIMERYVKPEHKKVLVLLPCSAKKPYHTSKTHKAFASAIHTASHDTLVHEVIVTSPLGAVPRELDVFYPANSYDIPVTGQWKCEEKAMIRRMIGHIIDQGYDKVISHLGEDTELVEGLAEMTETCVGDSTSPASLENLDAAVREATKGMAPVDYMIERRETVRSILRFQFGPEVADAVFSDGSYAIGKFPYWKIFRDKDTQLGMLTPERGMVSLTIDGAKILQSMGRSIVQMTDFELKGSLFAVGVIDADPSIREGDEAVIVCNGEVRGVGVAMMCGREMKELKRGVAVKVRHKI